MNKVFTGFDNSTCETVIDKGNMFLRRNLNEFVIEFYINTVYNRLTVNSFICYIILQVQNVSHTVIVQNILMKIYFCKKFSIVLFKF